MDERERIKLLVAEQLALVEDPPRRAALAALLVEPRVEERDWDYGEPGVRYPYWVVAEAPARGLILVYSACGFGPEFPWGYLITDEPEFDSLGMDAQWNWYLEEAFVRSRLWNGPVKPGYEEAFHLAPRERFAHGSRPDA
jgi:hypothetical protein